MPTLSINRKPKGLYSKAEPKQPAPAKATSSENGKVTARAAATGGKKSAASGRNHRRLEKLAGLFPNVVNLSDPKPMKVGILRDMSQNLKERGVTFGEGQIKNALARYTRNRRYQSALAAGGSRYNIAGQPEGEVTAEQQQKAADALEKMKGGSDGE